MHLLTVLRHCVGYWEDAVYAYRFWYSGVPKEKNGGAF